MNEESPESRDATSRIEEGVLTTPDGDALPRVLDRGVTMDLVQRFVETERNRSRRLLLWTGTIFFFVILLVLVLFVGVGVFTLKNARRAVKRVDVFGERTALNSTGMVEMTGRIDGLSESNADLKGAAVEMAQARTKNDRALKKNLRRFHKWILTKDKKGSSEVSLLVTRMKEVEREAVAREQELASLRKQYDELVKALAAPSQDFATVSEHAPAQTPDVAVDELESEDVDSREVTALPSEEREREVLVVTFSNGDRYEGEFKDGLFDGWGAYYYRNGDRYEGAFRNDMKHGEGTFTYKNGDRYNGEFRKDVKDGVGSLTFGDGNRYVGRFSNGMIDGKGVMLYAKGNRYEGDFKKGLKHGEGVFRFANGDVYDGEFKDDARHGTGAYTFGNGAKYIGDFKNGKRHGRGRYIYASGEEYRGDFRNGEKDGEGVCIYPNGQQIKGLWKKDLFVRAR